VDPSSGCQTLKGTGLPVLWTALALFLVGLLGGCTLLTTPSSAPTVESPTATASVSQGSPVTPTLTALPDQSAESEPVTLTIWLPAMCSPLSSKGKAWRQAFEAFNQRDPLVQVRYLLKEPYGVGGILNLLLTTHAVVPERLPDLVALDAAEVEKAAEAGILQPLNDLLPAAILEDLYPFAIEAGSIEGQLLAVQFETEIPLLVYDSSILPNAPITWSDILTGGITYIFPAGEGEAMISGALVPQYLGLGGRIVNDEGKIILDQEKLTQVLGFYRDGVQQGVIPLDVLDMTTLDDCWSAFKSKKATIAHVSSTIYEREYQDVPWAGFGFIPTATGPSPSLSTGWCWAVTTSDPVRRKASAELIAFLMEPEVMAMWSRDNYRLPTRRSALLRSIEGGNRDGYLSFLQNQLERAVPCPRILEDATLSQVLQDAVRDVIRGDSTPEVAAGKVVRVLAAR